MSALNVFLLNNAFCVCSCMNMLNIIISGVNVSLKPIVDTSLNYVYSVRVHLSPCNCYKEGLCSDKHVQIALLIGNVQ